MTDMRGMPDTQQSATDNASRDMSGMTMPDMMGPGMDMPMTGILGGYPMTRDASGTSWQPDAAGHRGIYAAIGDCSLVGHMMLPPEPFMGKGGNPLLMAAGETANGVMPFVRRPPPYNLFMAVSATYSHRL